MALYPSRYVNRYYVYKSSEMYNNEINSKYS